MTGDYLPGLIVAGVVIVLVIRYFTGHPLAGPVQPAPYSPTADRPQMFVRIYRASSQEQAAVHMRSEAAEFARQGYVISSQSWAPGSYGCGAFLVALVLFVVVVGILVFLYMLFVKPAGTLSVTYVLREGAPVAPSAMADLERLAALRDTGSLTPAEFDTKKAELLGRI